MTVVEVPTAPPAPDPADELGVPVVGPEEAIDEQPGDELRLLPTGRVLFRFVDEDDPTQVREVRLRRPLLGQYRRIREVFDEQTIADRERREAATAERRAMDGTVGLTILMGEVFRLLAGEADADPEQLPAWITDPGLPMLLFGHWRAVPLARSSNTTPQRATT